MFFKKKNLPYASAIIAAAGSGTRMGMEKNKVLLDICDEPVLTHTINAFMDCELIKEIIIVAKTEDMLEINKIVNDNDFDKVKCIIRGGSTRTESVKIGVLESSSDIVCIHDGARPLVTEDIIMDTIVKCAEYKAVTAAVKVKDTIKKVNDDKVVSTLKREDLYSIQTPQVFNKELLLNAYKKIGDATYNDDCQMLENLGVDVYITEGSYENIKITTKEDLIFANAILSRRIYGGSL